MFKSITYFAFFHHKWAWAFTHKHKGAVTYAFVHWTNEEMNSILWANSWKKKNIQRAVCRCQSVRGAMKKLGGTRLAQLLIQQSFEVHIFPISQAVYCLEGGNATIICINLDHGAVKKRNKSLRYWPPVLRQHKQPPAAAGKYYLITEGFHCWRVIVQWQWQNTVL